MKKQLWNKAFGAIRKRYGNAAPIEITNRFLTEQAEMQDTDMIVYLDVLSVLASEANKQDEYTRVRGGIGASFVSYLLGATEINPLKPHYVCPECQTVVFDKNAKDGWDLPKKKCLCGKEMQRDGHDISFETYRHTLHRNTGFDVSMSPSYLPFAQSVIREYFKDCNLTVEEREPNKVITFTVSSEKSECAITLCVNEEFTRYKKLRQATATYFERIPFVCDEVLTEFQQYNTDGITEFKTDFMKDMLHSLAPRSFYELIQIAGVSHGTGVWMNNGEELIKKGYSIANVIAYRDDVFTYIQERMLGKGIVNTGFAYKVMENTRKGLYARSGLPEDVGRDLKAIGLEDWFVDSIGKIKYLFPKAHGIIYVKSAAILMWYKIHYPKEFREIML